MTNLQGNFKKTLGDLYGLKTRVEYGLRQCKQELGWTDYRFTTFQHIEKWWEITFSVSQQYGVSISGVAATVELNPSLCPLAPCPLKVGDEN
jgi:hypothetical protein